MKRIDTMLLRPSSLVSRLSALVSRLSPLVFSLVTLSLSAQDAVHEGPWSLSDCIDYALEHNITVQQSRLSVLQSETELSSARARRLPGLSAGASQNYSFGRGLTEDNTYSHTNTTNTSFSVGADVPVFQGFTLRNNVALSRLNLEAATIDLEKARDDIRIAVAQAYVQVLYNREILAVAEEQVALDSLQVARLAAMYANGKASSSEVSAQEATLAQSRLSAIQAQGNLELALLDLTQLLELPSAEGFTIVPPSSVTPDVTQTFSADAIYAEASQVWPSLRSERVRLQSSEKNIAIAKGGGLPSLSLSGGMGSNYYTASGGASGSFGTQLKDNFSQYIGLSLSVPLFDRLATRCSVRQAQLAYRSQELQLENAGKALYKEIQQACCNAATARSRYEGSLAAEKSAREAFVLISAKYEHAKANITEYNEAKNRLVQAASDRTQARWQYLYQTRLLDFYRGADIVF